MHVPRPSHIRELGPVRQIAFVPADMDQAVRFWTEVMGVGPFHFMRHIDPLEIRYRGESTKFDMSIALAYWGDMQIELIEQHDDVPSLYTEWKRAGGRGVHHVCLFQDDLNDARDLCARRGHDLVQEFDIADSGAIYVATGGDAPLIEILQMNAYFSDLFATIQKSCRDWDGRMPVREIV